MLAHVERQRDVPDGYRVRPHLYFNDISTFVVL